MGCLEIWEQICDVQGRFGNEYGRGRGGGEATVPLPDPKMDSLATVRKAKKAMVVFLQEVSREFWAKAQ